MSMHFRGGSVKRHSVPQSHIRIDVDCEQPGGELLFGDPSPGGGAVVKGFDKPGTIAKPTGRPDAGH